MAKVHFVNSKVLQAGDGVGGDDLSQYATITYSDAEDAKIRKELEDVQSEGRTNTYEVQPTLNNASVGQCVFSNPNGAYVNQGSIQFSATDLSGHSIHWALIKPGNSFIITELNSDDYAVGEVKSVNTNTNTVQVRIFEGEGSPLQGDILHFAGSPFAARNDTENDYLTETEGDAKYARITHFHNYADAGHVHDGYIPKEADNSTYKDWLLKADGNKKNPADFASSNHTHSQYAATNHSHSEYAATNHIHSEYAATNHSHSEYAATNHSHSEYATQDYTDQKDTQILASANAYTNESVAALNTGTDVTANYDWTGTHKFRGGNLEINNTYGGVTYKGYKSDYSGSNDRSFMRFQLNANGEYYLHFGPTGNYWETRWTLNTGKMTWGQSQTSTAAVEIDKYGLKVQGSSVTRNATILQALHDTTDFTSLKAKLIELLEAEVASYEVDE